MSTEVETVAGVETQKQYVCFVKSCAGVEFVPYMMEDKPDTMVVKSLREFLDREIDVWLKASSGVSVDTAVISVILLEQFAKDVRELGMNSKLASMLGWNYARAARIVENEGVMFIMTTHPRFESRPFSFIRVRDDDYYALHFVEQFLSVRGGEIAFEEYDPEKHVAGYRYKREAVMSMDDDCGACGACAECAADGIEGYLC